MEDREDYSADGSDDQQQDDDIVSCPSDFKTLLGRHRRGPGAGQWGSCQWCGPWAREGEGSGAYHLMLHDQVREGQSAGDSRASDLQECSTDDYPTAGRERPL